MYKHCPYFLGGLGAGSCVLRGDLGSDNSSETKNTNENHQVALNNGGIGVSSSNFANSPITISSSDPEVVKKGLELAEDVANYSLANVSYALEQMRTGQERALETVEKATAGALQSAPVSPGAYAEATAGQFQQTLVLAAIGGAVFLFISKFSKK